MKSRRTSCVFFALRSVPVFVLVLLLLRPSLITAQASTSVVVQWNNAALQGVRDSKLGPPMVARALAIVHTCIYDAWAAYDDRARGTQFGAQLRRPQNERTLANKNQAISFAAYRALMDLMPLDRASVYDPLMVSLCYNPNDTSTDVTKPSGIGNVACGAVLGFRHFDGSNQLNNYVGVGFIGPYTPDRALLWRNGTRIDLNTLIPEDSGYHLIMAFDVNARGEIVVCAVQKSTGHVHAALLTPQPANISGNARTSAAEETTALPSLSPTAQRNARACEAREVWKQTRTRN